MQITMMYAYVISKLTPLHITQGSRVYKFIQSSGSLMKQLYSLGHF